MKPIVNSLTPSAIRAEHSEIENLRLENKNLVAQLDSSRSELATAQKTVEELKAKKMSEVTPALIMDYASVQAERDSLRSELQSVKEERDGSNAKCRNLAMFVARLCSKDSGGSEQLKKQALKYLTDYDLMPSPLR